MDTQSTSTSSLFAMMPLTQLILAFVALCALIKVATMLLIGRNGKLTSAAAAAAGYDAQIVHSADGVVSGKRAPQPMGIPILGNVLSMAGYDLPYQSFGALGKRFGPIIGLQLGNQPSMVVNGIEHIKEVLITKSSHFDSRPNFKRYHDLFSGNKENSLAFCNWSDLHKMRRDMLVQHSFPRNFSARFEQLDTIVDDQMSNMLSAMSAEQTSNGRVAIKPLVLRTCANVFTQYFCSRTFADDDAGFNLMINNFDKIFYEVNQGYLADFVPALLPVFHGHNLRQMQKYAHEIRNFILGSIIEQRREQWSEGDERADYVDSLIAHVEQNAEPRMEWDTALFALEDMIGGHSAVGNFLVKVFGYVVQNAEVQRKIAEEVERTLAAGAEGKSTIGLADRSRMPYTDAVILEALRMIASPIVPHVASQDSTVGGYFVAKDTMLFLNNYELSMSEELWVEPTRFNPDRFLQNGRVVKPDHFLPFGAGRRSCMGYKLVQFVTFAVLTSTVQHYELRPAQGEQIAVAPGSLAVGERSYEFELVARC